MSLMSAYFSKSCESFSLHCSNAVLTKFAMQSKITLGTSASILLNALSAVQTFVGTYSWNSKGFD